MGKQVKFAKQQPAKKVAQDDDSFVSDDAISSGSARYLKLVKGENRVRFISKPIFGFLQWAEDEEGKKRPQRTPLSDGEPEAIDDDNKPKKFMAAVVIDQEDGTVKIWEITQQSIIKAIKALSGNPSWGHPFSYDIAITKSGEDLKTKYVVTPEPKTKLSKSLIATAQESPCNLAALFENEDPWEEDQDEYTEYELK
jgi:hypothetical protein